MYAHTAISDWYSNFISGDWFNTHTESFIGFIAVCQALIAIGVSLKGWLYKISLWGAVVFLLAIMPLGMGSAFPCTISMATAALILLRSNNHEVLWKRPKDL